MIKVNKKALMNSYDLQGHHWKAVRAYSDRNMGLLSLEDKEGKIICAVQYRATTMPLLILETQFNELIRSI